MGKTISFKLTDEEHDYVSKTLERISASRGISKKDVLIQALKTLEGVKVEYQVGGVIPEEVVRELMEIKRGIGDLRADLSHVVSKVDEVVEQMKKPKEPVPRRKPYSKIAEEHLRAQAAEEKEDAQWYWDHLEELALRWDTLTERAREAHLRRIRELGLMQHFRFYLERRKGLHRVVV